jgi:hypothetical protein
MENNLKVFTYQPPTYLPHNLIWPMYLNVDFNLFWSNSKKSHVQYLYHVSQSKMI